MAIYFQAVFLGKAKELKTAAAKFIIPMKSQQTEMK
jgi:hypothetical protein